MNFKLPSAVTSVVIVIKKICPYGDRQQPLETAMHSIIHMQLPEECARSALPVQSIERSAFFLIGKRLKTYKNRCIKVGNFYNIYISDTYLNGRFFHLDEILFL